MKVCRIPDPNPESDAIFWAACSPPSEWVVVKCLVEAGATRIQAQRAIRTPSANRGAAVRPVPTGWDNRMTPVEAGEGPQINPKPTVATEVSLLQLQMIHLDRRFPYY